MVTAEGIPSGYLSSPVHVPVPTRTFSPPMFSGHTAYCNVPAAHQQGQPLSERDAVMTQVLLAHNIKCFGQQRQLCAVVFSKSRTSA